MEVKLNIENDCITLIVEDKGQGFKPNMEMEKIKKESFTRNSGRGMMMMKSYFDEIKYNKTGNAITLIKNIK